MNNKHKNTEVSQFWTSLRRSHGLKIRLYSSWVQAGFPSPADDHLDKSLDLNELMVNHPAATFFVRVAGDSMIDAGIFQGDILVIDRSLTHKHNDIVLAMVGNEYTIKRLSLRANEILLCAENPRYKAIKITSEDELIIWGVVSGVVRQVKT